MLINALVGFLAALGIFLLLQWIKRTVYSPLPVGENMRFSTLISIHGPAPELEAAVKTLRNLRDSGAIAGEIVLIDRGMDPETADVAEKLAREGDIELRF